MQPISSPVSSSARSHSQRRAQLPTLDHVTPQTYADPIARVNKGAIHWKRKLFHVLGIGTVGVAYALTPVQPLEAVVILGVVTALFTSLDLARFWIPGLNKKVRQDFGMLMRDYELNSISGSSWFLLSSILCVAAFPKVAAALGFVYLALGDPIASWAGLRWGRTKLPGGKSVEGSLALVTVCAIAGTAFLALSGIAPSMALGVAVAVAFAAAFAEWLPVKGIDDNFIVPLVTGAAATGVLGLVSA